MSPCSSMKNLLRTSTLSNSIQKPETAMQREPALRQALLFILEKTPSEKVGQSETTFKPGMR